MPRHRNHKQCFLGHRTDMSRKSLYIAIVVVCIAAIQAIRVQPGLEHYYVPETYDVGYGGHAIAPAVRLVKEKPLRSHEKEQQQDFSKIPGIPGKDYPLYHSVPETSFSCDHVPFRPGMYANVETHCQAYHICHDGREGKQGSKFLCTNGTLFNQEKFTCDWWYNVNCNEAVQHYSLNTDPLKNPYFQKPKKEEAPEHGHVEQPVYVEAHAQPAYYHPQPVYHQHY